MNKVIDNYTFLYISQQTDILEDNNILKNIQKSKNMFINQYNYHNQEHQQKTFILIGFKKTIIIIEKALFSILQTLFTKKDKLNICILSEINDINFKFNNNFSLINIYNDDKIKSEIESFNEQLELQKTSEKDINQLWKKIMPCISGYLIKESYEKMKINRLNNFIKNKNFDSTNQTIINKDEFIELSQIGRGSTFITILVYHIEKEELFVIKKTYLAYEEENQKLIQRAIKNHSKLYHQFLPRYIGSDKNKDYIAMEFINGKTLLNTNIQTFSFDEKITIIFEIMIIIEYLHRKHFILRDLKPDNIMIDLNNTAVLIDFDRMIEYNESLNTFSNNFSSIYIAPEVNSCNFSYECDIYSLGLMIFYIIESMKPNMNNLNKFANKKEKDDIHDIIKKCIKKKPEERPSIIGIILEFYYEYHTKISIDNLFEVYIKKLNEYYNLDELNQNKTEYFIRDKPCAQFYFGLIYHQGILIPQDINKAIHYYSLAANQNDKSSQHNLGFLYYQGKYVQKDIRKAFHFFTLAANQKVTKAYYCLGLIYESGEIFPRNAEKAIYYYSLAAN